MTLRDRLRALAAPLRRGAARAGDRLRRRWSEADRRTRIVLAGGLLVLTAFVGGTLLGTWANICRDCPSIAQIHAFEAKEASQVYAADGTLLAELAVERRTVVPLDSLPPHVPAAFVAVEDRRFWDHGGVDVVRTFRAGLAFLVEGYDAPGGSTITQQLAGNMFSESVDRRVVTIRRKLKEMRVALALERVYSKEEILQAYLNQINFGDGHYGIQSAAHYYFDLPARALTLPQAALLAALPRAPATYSPIRHPERALARRNLVLELMASQGKITRAQSAAAKAHPLDVRSGASRANRAPYFVEWVRRILMDRYGMEIYSSGLRVHTTLRPEVQAAADSALHAQLRWIEERPGFRAPTYEETRNWSEERLEGNRMPYLQGGFLAMEPRSGEVLALIGGRDFRDSEFNRMTQARRQPGSVFKPFVYTAAIASGIPASEIIYDTPVEIPLPDSTVYAPRNFTGEFRGPMTLREALYRSINVVAVKLGRRVGYETVAQFADRMGIRTPVPRVPSVSIGAASVIPLQVAEAYTTFANEGVRVTPHPIRRVENSRGEVLWERQTERERVLEGPTAWIMLSILRDVVDRGTGVAVRSRGLPAAVPAAGKTGTTNEATNAWFVGFTPEMLATAWVGFDEPSRIRPGAQGGVDAAPIVAEVLRRYYGDRSPPSEGEWAAPDEVVGREVDAESGLLSTPWCPAETVYTEYYLPGTEPVEGCTIHGPWNSQGIMPDTLDGLR